MKLETKIITVLLVVLVVLIATVFTVPYLLETDKRSDTNKSDDKSHIITFEDCRNAGNPVAESFPEQCRTQNGDLFVNWRGAGQFCIQVITTATNPKTGEERDFPTLCDVPEGWRVN